MTNYEKYLTLRIKELEYILKDIEQAASDLNLNKICKILWEEGYMDSSCN